MDRWTDVHIGALVEDTCGDGKSRGARAGAISKRDKEESASMSYDRKVKVGHIRAAVRQTTDCGKGGVLHINSTDHKTGKILIEVLKEIGRLINLRHNILAKNWGDLYGRFLTPSAVSDKPRIHTGRQMKGKGEGARQAR